jgi:hypothetical protein
MITMLLTGLTAIILSTTLREDYQELTKIGKNQKEFKKKRAIWKLKSLDQD